MTRTGHDDDCPIDNSLQGDKSPYNGICVCGYGWQRVQEAEDFSELYSEELMDTAGLNFEALRKKYRKMKGLRSKLGGDKI